jgi:hypothetical protein
MKMDMKMNGGLLGGGNQWEVGGGKDKVSGRECDRSTSYACMKRS